MMKQIQMLLVAIPMLAGSAWGQGGTIASFVDAEVTTVEKLVLDAAQAMPENKYDFSPEKLAIPGAAYKDVRTFAQQVKHIAASNYALWAGLSGESVPRDYMGGTGPDSIRTKAEILTFLKDSFAVGHKAAATLTGENMLQRPEPGRSSRLRSAMFGVEHAYDTYGQLIEYLRMNGIVPPASRGSRHN